MSVHVIPRRHSPPGFDVRWRDDDGQWSRRFEDREEAEAFDRAMKARVALERAKAAWAVIPTHWREAVDAEVEALRSPS